MWGLFAIAVVVGAAFLFAPGFLLLRSTRLPVWLSIACAPAVSVVCYAVLCAIYGAAGLLCSWASVFVPVLVVSAIVFALRERALRSASPEAARRRERRLGLTERGESRVIEAGRPSWHVWCMAGYVVIGLAVTCGVFLCQLASPDAFIQSWDNVHHLDTVRGFVGSGRWSSFDTSLYLGDDAAFDPFSEGSFYPSGWHEFASMIASALGCSAMLAMNAANVALVAVVLPLGTYAFLRAVFGENKPAIAAGSLFVLANASCPWMMLTWGPLYPNVMVNCLLPGVMAAFVVMLAVGTARSMRIAAACTVVLGAVSFVFVQPNGVFTAVVLLAPYLVVQSFVLARHSNWAAKRSPALALASSLGCAVLAVAVVVAFWLAVYHAPFMQAVVQYRWPFDSRIGVALTDVMTQRFHVAGLSIGCALVLAVGIVSAFARERHRWLVCSWLLACSIYVACVAFDGEWHQLLCGFWYTDVPRIAAFAAFAAVPLQALGLAEIVALVSAPFKRGRYGKYAASTLMVVLVGVLVFSPIEATESTESTDVGRRQFSNANALRVESEHIASEYRFEDPRIYDEAERAFVREALSIIPPGSIVVNEPNDGSAYAYGVDGLRTYYRYWRGYGDPDEDEKDDSVAIRSRLYRIASDGRVKEAVESTGVEYVLQLERGARSWNTTMWLYGNGRLWRGIDWINENTPGFELVMERDDMRLYKIVL